jgi:hypothetical protein
VEVSESAWWEVERFDSVVHLPIAGGRLRGQFLSYIFQRLAEDSNLLIDTSTKWEAELVRGVSL